MEESSEVETDITRKRVLADNENNNEISSKKLKETSGLEEILRKLGTIERKVDDMQNERKFQFEKVEDSGESGSFDDVDKMFKESSTVGQLEKNLQSINFKKVEDVNDGVDGFYCELCFGGSEPNWERLPKSAAGLKIPPWNLRCFGANCNMSRITRFLCYFFGLKFASVLFFYAFPSLLPQHF